MNGVKNKLAVILIVCLLITSAVFLGLWQKEKYDRSDNRNIAASAASSSLDSFRQFKENGDERYYYSGVAEFCTFNTAYGQLVYDTNDSANALFCNEVYGSLIMDPQKSMTHIDDIISVMEIIAADIDDPNGYNRMASLRNSIKE